MRRLLFVLLFSAVAASAQVYMYADSEVWADQGSGSVTAYAYTEVYDYQYNFEASYYLYADVYGTLSPNNVSMTAPTNNCGQGCAWYEFQAQVPYLGVTLSLNSLHTGQGFDDSYGYFWFGQYTTGTYSVPNASSLTFSRIDAREPNNVLWSIASGGNPWQINFYFAGNLQFTSGQVASTNQTIYPSGFSQAYLQGVNYGIPWNGQSCTINRSDNMSLDGSTSGSVLVGGEIDEAPAFQTVTIKQVGAFNVTKISYYDGNGPCTFIVDPGSLTTMLLRVSDSIDSTGVFPGLDADILNFIPTAMYPPTFAPISLPQANWETIPGQSARFQTHGYDWSVPPFAPNWIPSPRCTGFCAAQDSQACTSSLYIGSPSFNVFANLGCWFRLLP